MEFEEILLKFMDYLGLQDVYKIVVYFLLILVSAIPLFIYSFEGYLKMSTTYKRKESIKDYIITKRIFSKLLKNKFHPFTHFDKNIEKEDKKVRKLLNLSLFLLITLCVFIYFYFTNIFHIVFLIFLVFSLLQFTIPFFLIVFRDYIKTRILSFPALISIRILNILDLSMRIFGIFNILFLLVIYLKFSEIIRAYSLLYLLYLFLPLIYALPILLFISLVVLPLRKKVIIIEANKFIDPSNRVKDTRNVKKFKINIIVITKDNHCFKGKIVNISNDDYIEIETKKGQRIPIFWDDIAYVKI